MNEEQAVVVRNHQSRYGVRMPGGDVVGLLAEGSELRVDLLRVRAEDWQPTDYPVARAAQHYLNPPGEIAVTLRARTLLQPYATGDGTEPAPMPKPAEESSCKAKKPRLGFNHRRTSAATNHPQEDTEMTEPTPSRRRRTPAAEAAPAAEAPTGRRRRGTQAEAPPPAAEAQEQAPPAEAPTTGRRRRGTAATAQDDPTPPVAQAEAPTTGRRRRGTQEQAQEQAPAAEAQEQAPKPRGRRAQAQEQAPSTNSGGGGRNVWGNRSYEVLVQPGDSGLRAGRLARLKAFAAAKEKNTDEVLGMEVTDDKGFVTVIVGSSVKFFVDNEYIRLTD